MNNKCGERIKTLRKQFGLSQEALGRIVGLQKSTIGKWEKGITKNIKRETIQIMSNYFNVSPVYLMGLDDDPQSGMRRKTLDDLIQQMTDEQLDALITVARAMVK